MAKNLPWIILVYNRINMYLINEKTIVNTGDIVHLCIRQHIHPSILKRGEDIHKYT